MREKVTTLTRDAACMSCHAVINPLGFSLEHFDAVGRWRVEDNHQPVDAHGEYTTLAGQTLSLSGARDVARFAAESDAAHRAFVTALFQHTVKQSPAAYGKKTLNELHLAFAREAFHIRKLLVDMVVVHALHAG